MKNYYTDQPNGYLESIQKGLIAVCSYDLRVSRGIGTRNEQIAKLKTELETKEALSRIRKIYEVEGNLTDCSADERYARRHQEIEPLIEAYFAWVKTSSTKLHLCRGCRLAQGVSCVFRFSS